jgi:hypothetical protein
MVAERVVFPVGDVTPVSVPVAAGWVFVSPTLGPFGYMFDQVDQPPVAVRRFRLRVCYSEEGTLASGDLEIKFDMSTPVSFLIPRVPTIDGNQTVCVHSGWKTFGQGSPSEVDHSHGAAFARRTGGSRNTTLYELYLEAHDFYATQSDLLANLYPKVSDRIIFPIDNSRRSLSFTRDVWGFQSIGDLVLAPFGYMPSVPTNYARLFRLRACHFDENVSFRRGVFFEANFYIR